MAKTNSGLVEYCKAQVGKPYWFGTFGQTASSSLYSAKKKQYPDYYTASDFKSQYGLRVHDCAGLIKGYLWSETPTSAPKYNAGQDYGATGFYGKCTKKGAISSFDNVAGRLLFRGKNQTMSHMAVYIGGGEVIEAKGHAYGVVKTKFASGNWTHWGQCHLIEEGEPTPLYPATYKVQTNGGTLSLRDEPKKTGSNIVAEIPNGTEIFVTEIVKGEMVNNNTDWAHTTYNGKEGYCTCSWLVYVSAEKPKEEPEPTPEPTMPAEPPNLPAKSVEELAREIIEGKWGNGVERKKRLEEAGYNYDEVQAKVNELLGVGKPNTETPSTYTVKKGDNLWNIASRFLGKGSRYPEIKSINGLKSDIIYEGQVLKLPRP